MRKKMIFRRKIKQIFEIDEVTFQSFGNEMMPVVLGLVLLRRAMNHVQAGVEKDVHRLFLALGEKFCIVAVSKFMELFETRDVSHCS